MAGDHAPSRYRVHGACRGLVEFTGCDLNKATEFKSVESKFGFSCTTTFEDVDGSTRFTYRTETTSGFDKIFGKLARPILASTSRRALRANLKNLARVLSVNGWESRENRCATMGYSVIQSFSDGTAQSSECTASIVLSGPGMCE